MAAPPAHRQAWRHAGSWLPAAPADGRLAPNVDRSVSDRLLPPNLAIDKSQQAQRSHAVEDKTAAGELQWRSQKINGFDCQRLCCVGRCPYFFWSCKGETEQVSATRASRFLLLLQMPLRRDGGIGERCY